jgi:hypothetical protein
VWRGTAPDAPLFLSIPAFHATLWQIIGNQRDTELMTRSPLTGWKQIAGAGLALSLLAGCSSGTPAFPAGASPSAPPATATATLSIIPTAFPEAAEPSAASETDPAVDDPNALTGYELIAAGVGEAVYSGYSCTIAPIGCACEIPVIEQVSFTFTPEGRLFYHFKGDGYEAEWDMGRLGPNQWGYTLPLYDQAGTFEGAYFALLTFNQDGYILNVGMNFNTGEIVTCPTVTFRRVMSPAAGATP